LTNLLRKWLSSQNNKAANKAGATRDDLAKAAQEQYASASKSGGSAYASVTSYLASATDAAKDNTFDTWSASDLKSYLDSYGVPTYQGSTVNELRAMAKRNANYFRYGTSGPADTIVARIQHAGQWVLDQLQIGGARGSAAVAEQASTAKHAASEAGQRATNSAKVEL